MVGRERLTQMYQEWQSAKFRLEMAQTTLRGAELEATKAEARFRGAVEMLAGAKASWTFDPTTGVSVTGEIVEGNPVVVAAEQPASNQPEPQLELRQTDSNGNVRTSQLPTNPEQRKKALRRLARAVVK